MNRGTVAGQCKRVQRENLVADHSSPPSHQSVFRRDQESASVFKSVSLCFQDTGHTDRVHVFSIHLVGGRWAFPLAPRGRPARVLMGVWRHKERACQPRVDATFAILFPDRTSSVLLLLTSATDCLWNWWKVRSARGRS